MSGQIFISYRREESRSSARILRDRLCRDLDPKQIFGYRRDLAGRGLR
jgi:hypothetical protein